MGLESVGGLKVKFQNLSIKSVNLKRVYGL